METISTFSSSTEREIINFQLPASWSELSDKRLRHVYQLIADGNDAAALQTLCLLQWGVAKELLRSLAAKTTAHTCSARVTSSLR